MRKLPLLFALLSLGFGGTAAADFAPPMRPTEPITAESPNGKYNVVLSPEVDGREDPETGEVAGYEPPKVSLYSGAKPKGNPIWSVELADELIPTNVLVADDGRYVAVLNEQGRELVAVLYGSKGQTIATYSLDQLLARYELDRVSRSIQRAFWSAGKHRLDASANRLVLNVAFGGKEPFTRSGGRAIEIELSTGKVLNRSPDVTAPVPELAKRLQRTRDADELASLAVQLIDSKDASANRALIATLLDASVPLDNRVAAARVLVALATDKELLELAPSMGREPRIDKHLLTAISRRKLQAARPHVERVQREAKDKSLQSEAKFVLEQLDRPPPPHERDLAEVLASSEPNVVRVGLSRLNASNLSEHLAQLFRLCAHEDKNLRREAHQRLVRYVHPSMKPDREALERLAKFAKGAPTDAAHAPMLLVLLAKLADSLGDSGRARALLDVARQAEGPFKDPGVGTATALLASIQLNEGRTKEAMKTVAELERMKDARACDLDDVRLTPVRFDGACSMLAASELARRFRASTRAPVALSVTAEQEGKSLVLVAKLANSSGGALEVISIRGKGMHVFAGDERCPPIVRPFIKRTPSDRSLLRPPKKLEAGTALEAAFDVNRCGNPGDQVRIEVTWDVAVKDASGTEWSAPLSAVTLVPAR